MLPNLTPFVPILAVAALRCADHALTRQMEVERWERSPPSISRLSRCAWSTGTARAGSSPPTLRRSSVSGTLRS